MPKSVDGSKASQANGSGAWSAEGNGLHGRLEACPTARLAAFEIVWIFLIFFLFAGSLPPDVGESHYLVKAKHYWQPSWCAGDLFVESRDAHAIFYWTVGWLTRFCSLTATAWIARAVTWLLLAWSWQRLSWAVAPRPLVSLLTVGLMLAFLKHGSLAGEWVVGGVEAKGFAYVLVFLALEAMVRDRWWAALVMAGAAGAFHVLVGGWTAVAIGFAWLFSGRQRPALKAVLPAAAVGLVLALPGLIPAVMLNAGVPKDMAREAARIYVFERLNHHLVYSMFSPGSVVRFQLLVLAWAAVAWMLRRDAPTARMQRVVAGAVAIAIIGVAIDQALVLLANLSDQAALDYQFSAAGLLRYYWFRMSDSLVPVGLALGMAAAIGKLEGARQEPRGIAFPGRTLGTSASPAAAACLNVAAIMLTVANLAEVYYARAQEPVPPAILQSRPAAQGHTQEWYRDWIHVCQWVGGKTPADAIFLTPREQQTFKWYAGRAEVVTWKDVPQDAQGLIEWKKRMDEVFPREPAHHEHGLAAFDDSELLELARKYDATYVLIDRGKSRRRLGLARVYPAGNEANASFEVYRVDK